MAQKTNYKNFLGAKPRTSMVNQPLQFNLKLWFYLEILALHFLCFENMELMCLDNLKSELKNYFQAEM